MLLYPACCLYAPVSDQQGRAGDSVVDSGQRVDGFWIFHELVQRCRVASQYCNIYTASFLLCFLCIYIGLAEFVENKKLLRPVLIIVGVSLIVLSYLAFIEGSIFLRRTLLSFSCSILSLFSAITVAGGNCKHALPARFLKYVFIFRVMPS